MLSLAKKQYQELQPLIKLIRERFIIKAKDELSTEEQETLETNFTQIKALLSNVQNDAFINKCLRISLMFKDTKLVKELLKHDVNLFADKNTNDMTALKYLFFDFSTDHEFDKSHIFQLYNFFNIHPKVQIQDPTQQYQIFKLILQDIMQKPSRLYYQSDKDSKKLNLALNTLKFRKTLRDITKKPSRISSKELKKLIIAKHYIKLSDIINQTLLPSGNVDILSHKAFGLLSHSDSMNFLKKVIDHYARIHNQNKSDAQNVYLDFQKDKFKKMIEIFLKHHRGYKLGSYPLHYALKHNAGLNVIELMIQNGADVNFQCLWWGDTPLHYAIKHNAGLDVIELLIKKGADVNLQRQSGYTPLHYAIKHNAGLNVIELLIQNGADVNLQCQWGNTPLHYAIRDNAGLDVIELLIQNGADVNLQRQSGYTPLHDAMQNNAGLDVIELLIQNEADVNLQCEWGNTPLHYAIEHNYGSEVIELLIQNGADVNLQCRWGDTPLHYAIRDKAGLDVIELLIRKGAHVNAQQDQQLDNKGNTIMHILMQRNATIYANEYTSQAEIVYNKQVQKLLLKYGYDTTIVNNEGQTANDIFPLQNPEEKALAAFKKAYIACIAIEEAVKMQGHARTK